MASIELQSPELLTEPITAARLAELFEIFGGDMADTGLATRIGDYMLIPPPGQGPEIEFSRTKRRVIKVRLAHPMNPQFATHQIEFLTPDGAVNGTEGTTAFFLVNGMSESGRYLGRLVEFQKKLLQPRDFELNNFFEDMTATIANNPAPAPYENYLVELNRPIRD
jgi:hypothetical protein